LATLIGIIADAGYRPDRPTPSPAVPITTRARSETESARPGLEAALDCLTRFAEEKATPSLLPDAEI